MQPYAPPAAPYPGPPATPGPTGRAPLPWEISEVLSGAWNVFTRNWAPLCVGMLIVGLIVGGPMMLLASPTVPGRGLNPACATYGSSVLILPDASLDSVRVNASLCTEGEINEALLYATVAVDGTHAGVWTQR